MKRENKRIINVYLRQLKSTLLCSASMKKILINEVKHKIAELENQIPVLSVEDLHREIGSPEEIARGFESREDVENLKAKAKKYTRTKTILWICFVFAIVAVAISIVVINSNDSYYSDIDIKTNIKETNQNA